VQNHALGRRKGDGATRLDALDDALIGSDPAFLDVLRLIPAVAGADYPVLITGETGTGKELVARTLHSLSSRSDAPFVAVNCGALPDSLFEDEVFGHERGAFTDARDRRPGLITRARGGILFLDEVDSLCPRGQVSLLRVLQDGRFRPLGSDIEQHVDVRFIAATNADIEERVDQGAFRADLHFRLKVFSLDVPPLRARRGDILPLARHFLLKHARDDGRPRELSSCAMATLLAYDWPGNVRELESAIIRALHLSPSEQIEPADFHLPVPTNGGLIGVVQLTHGGAAPANGGPALVNGGPSPVNGGPAMANGGAVLANGEPAPSNGGLTPTNGGLGGLTPTNGGLGGLTPTNGGLGGLTPANGGLALANGGLARDNGRPAPTNGGEAAIACEPSFQELKQDVLSAFERDYLRQLLDRHNGNVTRAARAAGKERRALGKLLRKHRIDPNEFSAAS
jgi:DNA-binding NtrC family response regulator